MLQCNSLLTVQVKHIIINTRKEAKKPLTQQGSRLSHSKSALCAATDTPNFVPYIANATGTDQRVKGIIKEGSTASSDPEVHPSHTIVSKKV